jgi:excisionase family DNA binding protein
MTPTDEKKTRTVQPRTVQECAIELNVSPFTIRAWLGQRRIGFVRVGRTIRIPVAEIRRVIEEGTVPALPPSRVSASMKIHDRGR